MDSASAAAAWFVLGALVGGFAVALFHRLAPPLAGEAAEPAARVVSTKRREASQRAVNELNSRRFRCGQCEYESTAGPLGVHQKKAQHSGRVEVTA